MHLLFVGVFIGAIGYAFRFAPACLTLVQIEPPDALLPDTHPCREMEPVYLAPPMPERPPLRARPVEPCVGLHCLLRQHPKPDPEPDNSFENFFETIGDG